MSKREKRRKREEEEASDSLRLPRYHMTVLLFK